VDIVSLYIFYLDNLGMPKLSITFLFLFTITIFKKKHG